MTYATETDIITLYGQDALFVADRDNSGAADAAVVAQGLVSATSEIDTYLAVRYELPVAGTHEVLKQCCVDIALYRMASASDVMTELHRERYDDALKLLHKLSDGKARLTLPVNPDASDDVTVSGGTGPNPIVTGGPDREFTRDKMRDF